MVDAVIIHTDEIALKGANRRMFERRLAEQIASRLNGGPAFSLRTRKGTSVIRFPGGLDRAGIEMVASRLATVFGIAHFVLAASCRKDIAAIEAKAAEMMREVPKGSFRVTTKRGDKSFPLTSMEVSGRVGGAVLAANTVLRVDLRAPDTTLIVEINADGAFVAADRREGAGGLPTGSAGTVVALLSGGIDSPVAAWKLMRRGCVVLPVHFHSYPYVGAASIDKVRRLAARLSAFQPDLTLRLVPLGDIQRAITAGADERMRVVLYRRAMLRLAERIAADAGALALVTGDSVGQVASQTLENIRTVSAAAALPVHRPLIGEDKRDIVAMAKRIGTYDVSVEPHDDCCSLFVPDRPELRATPAAAEREETRFDLAGLMDDALARTETVRIASFAKKTATMTAH